MYRMVIGFKFGCHENNFGFLRLKIEVLEGYAYEGYAYAY